MKKVLDFLSKMIIIYIVKTTNGGKNV